MAESDLLAAEMFNTGWSSGKTGSLVAWQSELTNLADTSLVEIFLERLEGDWDRSGVKKPWLYKDAWAVHAASGGFQAIMQHLEANVPQKDYKDAAPGLVDQFKVGILDGDILGFLENNVPLIALENVPFIRT